MTTEPAEATGRALSFARQTTVRVELPGHPGYDVARTPWNVAVDQRPAAVAYPASADEVAAVVRAAARSGLHVAPQGTGHNAGPLGPLDRTVLLRTTAMTGLHIDPVNKVARVEAGVLWLDVVEAAAAHGLAALHGSSPGVGVVGYSLGGGIGCYARQLGLAANSVTAVELVLADGTQVRADKDTHPDLFWAVRGGGGSFGVVTALQLRLYDMDTAYAGMLVWDQEHAEKVLRAWAAWTVDAPDCVTTSFRMLNLPPRPELPGALGLPGFPGGWQLVVVDGAGLPGFPGGRQLVVVDGAVLADDESAGGLLAALRALEPELDTFARVPAAGLVRLHGDPEGPTAGVSASTVLADLPDSAIETFLSLTGRGSGTTLLAAELRQLGGALARPAEGAGALPTLDGRFLLYAVAIAPTPEGRTQGQVDATALVDAMRAYSSGRDYLGLAGVAVDVSASFPEQTWRRLKAIRSAVDPNGVLTANHPVPRLYENGLPTR